MARKSFPFKCVLLLPEAPPDPRLHLAVPRDAEIANERLGLGLDVDHCSPQPPKCTGALRACLQRGTSKLESMTVTAYFHPYSSDLRDKSPSFLPGPHPPWPTAPKALGFLISSHCWRL